ncbi:Pyruvate/2-oxoglutarate dehydrogenase complex, dihydrolipoamide dehydrogenase (E3) component [Desulfomicrobium norvegicum]|uniref:Pyruvate/2-oxoglutarate dehydrogenase complex, dihydrolipoamide dehydrogenase (E3) component n=1 Tax=Desulfomicrobium norvegicum (strain DSM 1741 / NCIMB 8310) TaxID=52561 RepID=A0A8G2C3D6_DESNO|nr:mercuric reductase [Desulfomicrobium norvegicum]SFL79567.1 Pyruvate/2-oxoglutarate dehydrogenase complex, dihydrolipoamide dehydrogenase (E3) component [Desulfomicrobium norvegicum]
MADSKVHSVKHEPRDEHNRTLESLVHPSGWTNPRPRPVYNLVVIGGGTAGLVCAAGAAGLGAKVALIERDFLGGDCLNFGCVPSKALLRAGRAAAAVRDAGEFGVHVPDGTRVDFGQVMERMRRLRASIAPNDSARRFRDLGVDVFLGQGRFTDAHTVEVGGERLSFVKAVVATGARAAAPPIEGLETVRYLTNETIFSLTELPGRLAVIGTGPVGCELAQAFARFGSEVLLIESSRGLLPKEDRDAAEVVRQALLKDGVKLLCCGKEVRVSGADGNKIRLVADSKAGSYDEVVDELLIAVGRKPNVEGLGLEEAGVAFSAKGVQVDDHLRTTNPDIFAAGDVCSPFQFTHAADFMARTVLRNALFKGRAKVSALTIPWCTYTEPEIAHVGLGERDAMEKGIAVDTFTRSLDEVDRAILEGHTDGFVRVHVRKGTDRIVGATIVANNAGDMISEISLAMTNGLGLGKIANTIHPYPTQGEAIRQVADAYNRGRLTPLVKSLFGYWLSWQRRRK